MKKKSERLSQILGLDRCVGACLALMLLAACGQKGALYLPAPLPGDSAKPTSPEPQKSQDEPGKATMPPARP
jgi:predicted small lipoprotein YifL